jgi:hypothetical protein
MPSATTPKTVRTAEDLAALPVGSEIGLRGKNRTVVLTKTGANQWFAALATTPSVTHTDRGAAAAIQRVVTTKTKRATVRSIGA